MATTRILQPPAKPEIKTEIQPKRSVLDIIENGPTERPFKDASEIDQYLAYEKDARHL